MIVRPHKHWFTRLFVWHGSVLEKIYSRLLLNLALSIGVIFFLPWYEALGIKLTIAPFSILGVAIAIFLGFRNSACYARFNEARLLWGQLAIASRSLLREVKSLPAAKSEEISYFVNLQVAFCNCLRLTLRKKPVAEALRPWLREDELAWVAASHAPCNRILLLMGNWLSRQRVNGTISDVLWRSLDNHLNELSAVAGGCERITSTPLPFAYTLILHRTVYLFCIMLPFALVTDLHYMTPFLSVFISYTFISLDCLAEELEDPFGNEDNDLALDAICNTIERDLRDMNGESELPEKMKPNRHYQLS
jgi:putative membrane protein